MNKPPAILCNLFPEKKTRAITLSYDDGRTFDLRLADIFDQYGFKGTFHLNSGNVGRKDYITKEQVRNLSMRHEISVHSVHHPHLEKIPLSLAFQEVWQDKLALENMTGQMVRGMSYPFGTYSRELVSVLKTAGMEYSRTVEATGQLLLPEDFMLWHPTTHHKGDLEGLYKRFMRRHDKYLSVFYIWGHSYEFDADDNWHVIENFCKMAGGKQDIWYATNLEIYDYAKAVESLLFSGDFSKVKNPSATPVWLSVEDTPVEIPAGQQVTLF